MATMRHNRQEGAWANACPSNFRYWSKPQYWDYNNLAVSRRYKYPKKVELDHWLKFKSCIRHNAIKGSCKRHFPLTLAEASKVSSMTHSTVGTSGVASFSLHQTEFQSEPLIATMAIRTSLWERKDTYCCQLCWRQASREQRSASKGHCQPQMIVVVSNHVARFQKRETNPVWLNGH